MADEQGEKGYTPIDNEIIKHLAKTRISGVPMQLLWVIFRKTYGWNKKEDYISNSQFCKMTGLNKVTVSKGIDYLLSMNIINKSVTNIGNKKTTSYCFQRNYDSWKLLPKKVTLPILVTPVTNIGNKTPKIVTNIGNYKRKYLKQLYKRKYGLYVFLSDDDFKNMIKRCGIKWSCSAVKLVDDYIPKRDANPDLKEYKDHFRQGIESWAIDAANKTGDFDYFFKIRDRYNSLEQSGMSDADISTELQHENYPFKNIRDVVFSKAFEKDLQDFKQFRDPEFKLIYTQFKWIKNYFKYNDAEAIGYMLSNQFALKEKIQKIIDYYGGTDKLTGFAK